MSTSSATTSRSVSPFQPHQQQTVQRPPPTLEELIAYLLASKHSLTIAYQNIHVANTLIAASGTIITSIASVSARNTFLTQSLTNKVTTLRAVQQGLALVAEQGQTQFRDVLADLDDADVTMKQMVDVLKATTVTTTRAHTITSVTAEFEESQLKQQTLHDYVDESAVEAILAAFRGCIDEVTEAQDGLDHSIESFETEIEAVEKALTIATTVRPLPPSRTRSFADELDSIYVQDHDNKSLDLAVTTNAYQASEGHATEMAQLLQNLISHYDFCVKALRYTEGGDEIVAAEQAEGDEARVEEHRLTPHTLFMPEDERKEMLRVLCNDAEEVDDVVNELAEHVAEMNTLHESVQSTLDTLQQQQKGLKIAVRSVAEIGKKLPLYIEAGAIFDSRWGEQREIINSKLAELEALRSFYEGFVKAYGALGHEIARRNALHEKVDKVFAEAMKKVERLYEGKLYRKICMPLRQQPRSVLACRTQACQD